MRADGRKFSSDEPARQKTYRTLVTRVKQQFDSLEDQIDYLLNRVDDLQKRVNKLEERHAKSDGT